MRAGEAIASHSQPTPTWQEFHRATALYQAGRFDEAITSLERVVHLARKDPELGPTHYRMGTFLNNLAEVSRMPRSREISNALRRSNDPGGNGKKSSATPLTSARPGSGLEEVAQRFDWGYDVVWLRARLNGVGAVLSLNDG